MIEVVSYPAATRTVRDRASAEDAESAIVAARTLIADARACGVSKPRVAFYDADGNLIRYDVSPIDLSGEGANDGTR